MAENIVDKLAVTDENQPEASVSSEMEALGFSKSESAVIPSIAKQTVDALSLKKSVFALREWDKAFETVADPLWIQNPQWGAVRRLILKHAGFASLSKSGVDAGWALYTTESVMRMEEEMIALAKRQTNDHDIPAELIEKAFSSRGSIAEEQKNAVIASCSGSNAVMVTEGTAGAGKSFTLNAVREIYENVPGRTPDEQVGYDIIGTALSWTATKVLEASAGLTGGRAIEGLIMAMERSIEKGEEFFKRRTLLIVDEAGLVGSVHMHKILSYTAKSAHPVRVILTGDSLQLNPVMAGNALEAIVDECGSSRLDTIRRQKQESHRNAVKHFCFGRAENGLWTYWQQEAIKFSANSEARRVAVMRDYVRYSVDNPDKTSLILALENKEVARLNSEIRQMLKKVGRLRGREAKVKCFDGKDVFEADFAPGDQVVLRKNDVKHPVYKSRFDDYKVGVLAVNKACEESNLARESFAMEMERPVGGPVIRNGVFNRTAGTVLSVRKHPRAPDASIIRILLAEGGEIEIDTSEYKDKDRDATPLTHNFATTIYASQGQTVERVIIMDSPYMNRRLAYVGMSRHTELCDIYVDRSEVCARRSEEVKRRREAAWKSFDMAGKKNGANIDAARDALKRTLEAWPEKDATDVLESELLQTIAVSWNKDSPNPTAWMAKKHMNERKIKADREGADAWKPCKHKDDNPDDYPEPRHRRPPPFEKMQMQAAERMLDGSASGLGAFKAAYMANSQRDARKAATASDTSWKTEGLPAESLKLLRGGFWDLNRFGEERFFSMDPVDGHPVSRWTLYGKKMGGDGQVPVLPNSEHFSKAPWLVVPGIREALTAWSHYRTTRALNPERIPNIVIALQESDFSTLSKWVGNKRPKMLCVWSKTDSHGMARAFAISKRLAAAGFAAEVFPAPPKSTPATPVVPQQQKNGG